MTELWEDSKGSSRHPTTHAMADPMRVRHGAADELDTIIMASIGKPSALPAGGTTSGFNLPSTETSQTKNCWTMKSRRKTRRRERKMPHPRRKIGTHPRHRPSQAMVSHGTA